MNHQKPKMIDTPFLSLGLAQMLTNKLLLEKSHPYSS